MEGGKRSPEPLRRGVSLQPHRHYDIDKIAVAFAAYHRRADLVVEAHLNLGRLRQDTQQIYEVLGVEANAQGVAVVIHRRLVAGLADIRIDRGNLQPTRLDLQLDATSAFTGDDGDAAQGAQ